MSDTTPPGGTESGTDRLRTTAEEAREAAAEKWDEASEQARDTARATAENARRRAESEAERGKAIGAGQVHQWASALDRAAAELGRDSMQGQFLRQASEGLDDVARSIEGRSIGEMAEAVAQFGRRNPLAFVGGAMIAGFALSRFATASRPGPEWDEEQRTSAPRGPAAPPPAAGPATPPSPGPVTTGTSAGGPARASAAEEEELRLTESMRPEESRPTTAPGTASAPSGTGRPYPSAGPAPGGSRGESEEER